jgi:cytochrome P450
MPEVLTDAWVRDHFDYLAEDLAPVLPETLARMRSQCPVAHSDAYEGYWIVTRYEDVLRVAQDWETFSSAHGLSVGESAGAGGLVRNLPVEADPPEQRFFKRLINPYFTPAAVAKFEKPVRELANRLIDAFVDDGRCEFMDAFARPFPSLTFFEQALGAPPDDLEKVATMASTSSVPNHPDRRESWIGLYSWIKELVDRRRAEPPRGDVVDAVINARVDGQPLPEPDVIGTIQLLILGGLETTAGALGLMFHRFCAQPEIPARLRALPALIPKAVEELLRLDGPFIAVARTATRDVELSGRQIKQGDKVLMYWASADRDEEQFPDADVFDPERDRNPHFAFGAGPHRCAGSNLARLNLRIALEELLVRLDDIRLQDGADVHFHSTLTRSPLQLPITFTARPRA